MTKFRHLPIAGRLIIVAVAIGVFAIAVVACATSYNAIYRLVGDLGLYGYRINQAFPLMLDAAFLVAELAAILGGIMRAVTRSDEVSVGWPGTTMLLCGPGHDRLQRRPRLSDRRPRRPPDHLALCGGLAPPGADDPVVPGPDRHRQVGHAPSGPAPEQRRRPHPHPCRATAWPRRPARTGCSRPTRSMGRCPAGRLRKTAKTGTRRCDGGGVEQVEATKRRQVEAFLGQLDPAQLDRLGTLGPRAAAREVTGTLTRPGPGGVGALCPADPGRLDRRPAGERLAPEGRPVTERRRLPAADRPAPRGRPASSARPGRAAGRPRGAGLRPGRCGVRRPRVPGGPHARRQPGRGLHLPGPGLFGPGQAPAAGRLEAAGVDRPGGGGGVVAALAPRQPGPGHRSALRRARPGRRPGRGGAARRLVDRPDRASGAGGAHRRGRLASAVRPHRARQPGRAAARGGLAGPGRADRGPTLPARQRPPLHLGPAPDGDAARGPGRAAAAAGPTGGCADHPPPSPHTRPAVGAATGGRRWPGSGPPSPPPRRAAATPP